jgi:hypothetical protein
LAAFPMAVLHLGQFLFRRLTNPALIAWLVLLALATSAHDWRSHSLPAAAPSRPIIWLPLIVALVAIYGALWLGHVATGKLLEQRALNHLHFVLVGGLTLSAVAATHVHGESVRALVADRWPRVTQRGIAVGAMVLMLATPHFLQAVRILGQVGPLHRSLEQRFALLGDGKVPGGPITDRDLVLPPLRPGGTRWFDEAVSENPGEWSNGCVAHYAGVRSVRIDARPTPSN